MAQGFAEIIEGQVQQAKAKRASDVTQLRQREYVGRTMSEMIADPRWATYAQHIEAARVAYQQRADAVKDKLTSPTMFIKIEEYGQLKLDLATAESRAWAFGMAITLAETLIKDGETAAKNLKLTE